MPLSSPFITLQTNYKNASNKSKTRSLLIVISYRNFFDVVVIGVLETFNIRAFPFCKLTALAATSSLKKSKTYLTQLSEIRDIFVQYMK